MLADIRRKEICDILKKQSAVTTASLAAKFNVSIETIRKDLLCLERSGELVRVHGGAVPKPLADSYANFSERVENRKPQKSYAAHIAAKFVKNNDIIAIDCGSTAIEVIEALKDRLDTLTVVTHSMDVFLRACRYKNFNIILCGGFFDKNENSFYGDFAIKMLEEIRVSKAFIFPSSISLSGGICEHVPYLAQMQRNLINSSDEVFIVADSSKFGKSSLVKTCDINPKFLYITDSLIPESVKKIYKSNNIQLITSEEM